MACRWLPGRQPRQYLIRIQLGHDLIRHCPFCVDLRLWPDIEITHRSTMQHQSLAVASRAQHQSAFVNCLFSGMSKFNPEKPMGHSAVQSSPLTGRLSPETFFNPIDSDVWLRFAKTITMSRLPIPPSRCFQNGMARTARHPRP